MLPENWPAVRFLLDYCDTQWRQVGISNMAGAALVATGLDHTAVLANLRTLRLPREDADELYADVRHMERVALKAMRKEP